jgi:hypothetical protein
LIVLPKHDNKKPSDYIFGFEELENNLHPSLLRRLFNYISKYSNENNAYFFITTHSNIVIDLFGNSPKAQIVHVQKKGDYSTVTAITNDDHKSILKDLDYRPSDLLLSNGIIWVEGPSDLIYIELLLYLFKQKNSNKDFDKFSYTIQPLSTAIWKYAGFNDFDWDEIENDKTLQNKIVSLQKLNHNHVLVIDNDNNYDDKRPSEWDSFENGIGKNKAKLIYESLKDAGADEANLKTNYGDSKDGKLFFWINDGTFETYLDHFVSDKGKEFEKYFDLTKPNGYLEKKRSGQDSAISKVVLASQIAKCFIKQELTLDDLAPVGSALLNKIERLYKTIESWN